ncbi:LamG-like jellyroll fold domain-containing protein [Terrimonas rubra]|uniref:LamG-like jellyroll fold domain-containing protein n=1 Tax=Terrimonas rubra TaxID=1035890 RepID=A0ABW6A4Z5_9BACT
MNINFPNLNFLMIIARNTGRHSFDSLSFELPRLRSIDMFALDSLFARNFDSIINQLARVNNELNGTGRIGWSGTYKEAPTAASLSAREKLLGQNFQIAPFGSYNGGLNVPKDIFDFEPLREDDAFTNFFNRRNATEFIFREIKRFFVERCYRELDICSYQPPVKSVSTLLLCGKKAANEPSVFNQGDPCADSTNIAIVRATELYRLYTDSLKNAFAEAYQQKCLEAANREVFTVTHPVSEYHYTLYYYDQAGNLVKTVPPEGVHPNRDLGWLNDVKVKRAAGLRKVPTHTLATTYRYNSLNQVVSQKSPDGGYSEFWYDRLGRLTVSRNAKQLAEGKYSYTQYDFLGRITEVGQKQQTTAMTQAIARDPVALNDWLRYYYTAGGKTCVAEQVTATFYDNPVNSGVLAIPIPIRQKRYTLRNRVSYTRVYDYLPYSLRGVGSPVYSEYDQATVYCYDIHGNVDTLQQDYRTGIMAANGDNRFKVMTYKYDLISGKVNQVHYQPGQRDQLYHRYEYDAENRITDVYTSNHKLMIGNTHLEEHEAFYQYYKHGPLARTVLGQEQVQGIDYAYTLQGWLKGVNSDTLLDSDANALVDGGANRYVGRDAFRFSLNYYNGEYQPIGAAVQGVFPGHSAYMGTEYRSLYNGNISSMVVGIPKLGDTKLYNYQYDQLNRLVKMDMWQGYNVSNGWSGITKTNDYKEEISYDGNGNILTYLRNGNPSAGKPVVMDQLTYQYNKDVNQRLANNKLRHVQDAIGSSSYLTDIDNQPDDNYSYDAIGNLTADIAENITDISWNVYGKIVKITKTQTANNNVETIRYGYDVAGNRVSKWVKKFGETSGKYTQYVRDASGNVMAIYTGNGPEETPAPGLKLTEHHLYGSSRIGIWNKDVDMTITEAPGSTLSLNFERGNKFFELSNHLGNVLAVISDKKLAVDVSSDGTVDYYIADVVNAADYAPFGMQLPGRVFPGPVAPEETPTGATIPYAGTLNGYDEATSRAIAAAHNNFTIELWVNPATTHEIDPESPTGLAGVGGQKYVIDALSGSAIDLSTDAAGVGISVGTNGVSVYEHAASYMPCLLSWEGAVNGWTHIAVVYNDKTPYLYVNGVLVKTGLTSWKTDVYASNMVGSGYYGVMNGQFDEVRVWGRVRTQAEIMANMNSTVSAPQTDLAAYWPINDGESTGLTDMSGNGYDVVLNTAYSGSNFTPSTAMPLVNEGRYRYGFNGKENDNEVKGEGNQQDYGFRIYDPRLAKFLSVDPLEKEYPWNSVYAFAENEPISSIDLDGLERVRVVTPGGQVLFDKWGPYAVPAEVKDAYAKSVKDWYQARPSDGEIKFANMVKGLTIVAENGIDAVDYTSNYLTRGATGVVTKPILNNARTGIKNLQNLSTKNNSPKPSKPETPGSPTLGNSNSTANQATDNSTFNLKNINQVGGNKNCVNCAIATDLYLKGTNSSALNSEPKSLTILEKEYGQKFTLGLTIDQVKSKVNKPGQMGIVFGNRGTGQVGHVFNVVNQKGKINFVDGQTGKAADLSKYQNFGFLPTK